ncbi:MAG: ATP-binding protein, partial [Marmoricola sp.]
LIGNAVKFSPPDAVVLVSAVAEQTQVVLSVRDHGRGIPEDQLTSVFERFHQVSATDATEKGGTGLGLTITRSIVERHGGSIWVESVYGEGTVFSFTLPLAPVFAHEEHAPPTSARKRLSLTAEAGTAPLRGR